MPINIYILTLYNLVADIIHKNNIRTLIMFDLLKEDENDIFSGSIKSKLMDIIFNANNGVVRYELEKFINKTAAIELLVAKKYGEELDDRELRNFMLTQADAIEEYAKNLYMEMMGSILSQSE